MFPQWEGMVEGIWRHPMLLSIELRGGDPFSCLGDGLMYSEHVNLSKSNFFRLSKSEGY